MNSENGTTNHTPFTPKNCGKIIIPKVNSINVLRMDIVAEILPFENAVNMPDTKIFIPTTKKLNENIINPFKVILYKSVSFEENILIIISEKYLDDINIKIANNDIIMKLYFINFLICSLSLLP